MFHHQSRPGISDELMKDQARLGLVLALTVRLISQSSQVLAQSAQAESSPQEPLERVNCNGDLVVTSDPPGAAVYVGGIFVGQTPATLTDLACGEHTLQLEGTVIWVRRPIGS